ncbi:hypothetical protein [Kineobactrum salinum]|uniref:hypothetical protein n=1 Tax=Kineobactrum salinum TaxID=2708301 RepID=UPI0018D98B64|nr:hypothetical protein [Kineobactrum salinum]
MSNSGDQAISIVQRGNLKVLEASLRKQWRLGQNIVLCWSADERGLLVLFVPHYFLGNYCARPDSDSGQGNENFIRELISGQRRKERKQFFAIADRLDIAPGFIKLSSALAEEPLVLNAVEQLIKRYGLSYVSDRAVLLFDITDFSLFTPFEQASQLNSLSYSLNSAYNKLLARNITVNFSRTTTGDGYYVWNRDLGPAANRDLLYFMLLVVADNAVARAASRGNTVPEIRTGYHIGSHYELYQAEGVNPTVLSYIVGDVTIELARMVDQAMPGQMLVGHFESEGVYSPAFIEGCHTGLAALRGLQLAGKSVTQMDCYLTGSGEVDDRRAARRFIITDKHGRSRHAYNLECLVALETDNLTLGLGAEALPGGRGRSGSAADRRDPEPVALARRPQHQSSINEEPDP